MLVPIALYGWIGVALVFFALLPLRRAVICSYISAWLFLPMASVSLPGLPDYTKGTAAALGTALGFLLTDGRRVAAFRPRWFDVLPALFCLSPILSSLSNDLGFYNGLSGVWSRSIEWGLPYLTGRLYFRDLHALRELVTGIFVGGLVYVPLCLIEIQFSPQLHNWVYGYHQHKFLQTMRYGGFRPMVFMQHGLAVAMWMTTSFIAGFWLWRSGAIRRLWGMPTGWLVAVLLVTTILCKSGNGVALLVLGMTVLHACRRTGLALPLLALALAVPAYMAGRFTGAIPREPIVEALMSLDAERAGSLNARMRQEDAFSRHTWSRMWLGWGGFMRNFPKDDQGRQLTRGVDSMWVIMVSSGGVVSLSLMTGMLLVPVLTFIARVRTRAWFTPTVIGSALAATIVVLYLIDILVNAMVNPVFLLLAGGLTGVGADRRENSLHAAGEESPFCARSAGARGLAR